MSMKTAKFSVYAVLVLLSIAFIFPLLWAFLTAIKSSVEIGQYPPKFFPTSLHLDNFVTAWQAQPFTRYLMNSVIVTSLSVLGMTLSSAVVAYGFARFQFRGREFLFLLLLSTMMVPWDVLVIPLYMQFNAFGWLDTLLPLIVPAFFGGAFYIFLMRQFLRGIPHDFEESALIDGANYWQIFTKIFLPLMKPQLALAAIMYMIVVWNDYLGPLVYISDSDKFTLPIGLSLFKGAYTTDFTSIMAITVLMTLPTIIVFFFGQKQILNVNVSSGVKG
jgi:multiple sugar transport system permease protein